MLRIASGFLLLTVLSGCEMLSPMVGPPQLSVLPASFTDPACRSMAQDRVADGAVNGYDAGMQARVGRDSYNNCVTLKQGRAAMTGLPAAP